MYQAPRGIVDTLPGEMAYWRFIEQKAASVSALYGFERIDTPTFEETGLFVHSVGEETDIVTKEMYTFNDRSGKSMTLRPEGTAPVCRAYLEHGMGNLPQPVKLYYLADIFRYERPQAGRLRQFHQFGCETIGDADPALDAEMIDLAWQFCKTLGLSRLELKLNSIGCKKCRPAFIAALKGYYQKHADRLCRDCKLRLERNTLRLLDCKQDACQPLTRQAPRNRDYLCPECAGHFSHLQHYLEILGLPFRLEDRLVRGLDYYTRTVFEIQPEGGSSQSTIAGGGRYDDLIETLGGRPTPAVGFASGIERLILNLKKEAVAVPPLPAPHIFLASLGEPAKEKALRLAADLRKKGFAVLGPLDRSLKAQMRLANTLGVRYTVIIGEEEVKAGTVQLREMAAARQATVPVKEIENIIRSGDLASL
ncbi:MAG: histidine--tRNA ligase [Dehalococcoidia bacterium]|nr:MAG: histidine--tRNA ligase [Dehalococcoidia bacterium]